MRSLLQNILFIVLFIITSVVNAQGANFEHTHDHLDTRGFHEDTISIVVKGKKIVLKDFSYKYAIDKITCSEHTTNNYNHNHDNLCKQVSLIDIISSDAGSDFNCSGGFCMDKSHYHKKGITLKRQLFDYFMKISG